MSDMHMFAERRNASAFWLGSTIVAVGVLLHLPMFWMARDKGFILAGMPMDAGMLWGMALIGAGIGLAGYGLLPKGAVTTVPLEAFGPPEDAPLTRAHWGVMAVLTVALIIDIMKPASLGFVTPGMRVEYGIDAATVALVPISALIGTVAGSFIWGALADLYGRRAAILLSSVMFIGTSICGAMPSFWWNVVMCFLMGAAAGGMLPVTYALLAEIMPTSHRGWCLVIVCGAGAVGGSLASSFLSALLQPYFGWRIMWFLNLPTGLILIALSSLIPESARFLQQIGRASEARIMFARFGAVITTTLSRDPNSDIAVNHGPLPPRQPGYVGTTIALTLVALAWGCVNFGVLLWFPGSLVAEGRSMGLASMIIAKSTLFAVPAVLAVTWLYRTWSTKWSLVTMIAITTLGLLAVLLRGAERLSILANPVLSLALLIVGTTGVNAILLPYTAENYPIRVRGRASGWVAGISKLGGFIAQSLSVLALVPALDIAAMSIAIPATLSLRLIAILGQETRNRDLPELEVPST